MIESAVRHRSPLIDTNLHGAMLLVGVSCLFLVACQSGETPAPHCAAEEVRCNGMHIEQCAGDGSEWLWVDSCPWNGSCELGQCVCAEGQSRLLNACMPHADDTDLIHADFHPKAGVPVIPNILYAFAADGFDKAGFVQSVADIGGKVIAYQAGLERLTVRFDPDTSWMEIEEAKAALNTRSDVDVVVSAWLVGSTATPNDPWDEWLGSEDWDDEEPSGANWFLEMIHMSSAWDLTGGESQPTVKIGVIDFGDYAHVDLPVATLSMLSDGASWEAVYRDGFKKFTDPCRDPDASPQDHGVAVAGVLGAKGDNGEGVTGVLWNAEIYYCETQGAPTVFDKCMRWFVDQGVRVINYSAGIHFRRCPESWDGAGYECPFKNACYEGACAFGEPVSGGPCECASDCPAELVPNPVAPDNLWAQQESDENVASWTKTFESLPDAPWLLVQAAGNEALDDATRGHSSLALSEPWRSRTVTVGAHTRDAEVSPFSNRGPLDLVAPGGFGISGEEVEQDMLCLCGEWKPSCDNGMNELTTKAGTSFSAPLVSGVLALAWTMYPELSAEDVRTILLEAAAGTDAIEGYGRLDALAVVQGVRTRCVADGGEVDATTGVCQGASSQVDPGCTPSCTGKSCGDDGCGGSCGTCSSSETCQSGQCVTGPCESDCAGKDCGDDGCGGSCGTCSSSETCQSGQCVTGPCQSDCAGKSCGDDGCGGSCGTCSSSETCQSGQCVTGPCESDCAGKDCGDDGCGGSCGTCSSSETCQSGACVPDDQHTTVIHYASGWSPPYVHYGDDQGWTEVPGEVMSPDGGSDRWRATVTWTGAVLEFVFNDGQDTWDNPTGGSNYTTSAPEVWVNQGVVFTSPVPPWTACVPSCAGKDCGDDDGCGSPCAGDCPPGQTCVDASCQSTGGSANPLLPWSDFGVKLSACMGVPMDLVLSLWVDLSFWAPDANPLWTTVVEAERDCIASAPDCPTLFACIGIDVTATCESADYPDQCLDSDLRSVCMNLPNGDAFLRTQSCTTAEPTLNTGCADGRCVAGTCGSDDVWCEGDDVVHCEEGYTSYEMCSNEGMTCVDGTCVAKGPPCAYDRCEGTTIVLCSDGAEGVHGDCPSLHPSLECVVGEVTAQCVSLQPEDQAPCAATSQTFCDGDDLKICIGDFDWGDVLTELDCSTFLGGTCDETGDGARCKAPSWP